MKLAAWRRMLVAFGFATTVFGLSFRGMGWVTESSADLIIRGGLLLVIAGLIVDVFGDLVRPPTDKDSR